MGLRGPLPRSAAMPAPFPSEALAPPAWLPDGAVEVWEQVEPRLRAAGRTTPEWAEILANFAATAAELRRATVTLDSEPLTRNGPHGPVAYPLVGVVVKLRGTLAALGARLGLDVRMGGTPPQATSSALQEWHARHNSGTV